MKMPIKITKHNYNYEIANSNKGDINGKYKVMTNKEGFNNWYLIGYANSIEEAKNTIKNHNRY